MNRHRVGAVHALLGHHVLQGVAVLHGEAAHAGAGGRAAGAEHGTASRAHQGGRAGAERLQRGFQHGARIGADGGKGVPHRLRVADVLHTLGDVVGHRVSLNFALLLGEAHGQFDGRVVADAVRCGCCRPLPIQALEDAHLIEQQGEPSAPLGKAALHRLGDVAQEAALDGGHAGQVVVGNLGALDVRQQRSRGRCSFRQGVEVDSAHGVLLLHFLGHVQDGVHGHARAPCYALRLGVGVGVGIGRD